MKVIKFSQRRLEEIYNRSIQRRRRVESVVSKIIEDVRLSGDRALLRYTRKFDRVKIHSKQLQVSENEINGSYQDLKPDFLDALKFAIKNVRNFYEKKPLKSWKTKYPDGMVLGEIITPIEKVGIYIPGGTAPLISTVYMTVVPAQIAGVKEIYLTTPPDKEGYVNPYILAVANLLKVKAVFKVGGAQAIAALALGTKTIPRVDKIVGPGNVYVTEAKRQVFGYVDVDSLAGPSEVVIIANQHTNPKYIVADMKAQAEHSMGVSILITPSKSLIRQVKDKDVRGFIIKVKNLEEAAEISNRIAPEHIQIMVKNPYNVLKNIRNAGAIFIGQYTPTAVGDYVAGPSHVLPTGGTARFFSGLSVLDFVKKTHIIGMTKKSLENIRCVVEKISEAEGMSKHLESVNARL